MTPFGVFVRSLRMTRHLTMKQMANALGVSPSYLSVLEQGKRGTPSPEILNGIAKFFELNEEQRNELHTSASDSQIFFELPSDAPPQVFRIARLFAQSANRIDEAHLQIIQIAIEAGQKSYPTHIKG